MKTVDKAVAAVIRTVDGRRDLLVFTHPSAGVQLPKGTIEPDESIALATLRELEEESGLRLDTPHYLGQWDRVVSANAVQPWHVSLLDAPHDLPNSWDHEASGSPEEEGLFFAFHWLPLDADLPARLHPLFADAIRMIMDHFDR